MSQNATTRRGKIVCIGDLLVDVWWRVDTSKRNVEHAAVALTSNLSRQIRAGGAGLFANNAALAGFDVTLFSVADSEPTTDRMLAKLSKNVDTSHVQIIEEFHTPIKTRYINENGHILVRHDSESATQPRHNNPPAEQLMASLKDATCIVVSDYNKQCLSECRADVMRSDIVDMANGFNVPIYVDAKPKQLREYAGADLFKLNRAELEGLVGDQLDFAAALRTAATLLDTPLLIVTDGARGVGWCLRGQAGFLASPKKYSSGNCVGAGDTFFAGLLLGFSEIGQFDCRTMAADLLLTALKIALVAAGQRVRANGEKPFNPKKILREVAKSKLREPPSKLMSVEDMATYAATMRDCGCKVVFTNGCFDLLHAGHVQLLTQAKQQGELLLVGVDSDANVRRLKGDDRPIQDQGTRAGNIAALACVDGVCIFDEPDATTHWALRDLIRAIQPDVLVKGAEYATKLVVGVDEIRQQDVPGRVVLLDMMPNHSTTALVNKMKAMKQ
jgi:D-beta-D-heptose 7-phosphate kinase/D-beta-D-heptose 1-phosphate adenosyltransferase